MQLKLLSPPRDSVLLFQTFLQCLALTSKQHICLTARLAQMLFLSLVIVYQYFYLSPAWRWTLQKRGQAILYLVFWNALCDIIKDTDTFHFLKSVMITSAIRDLQQNIGDIFQLNLRPKGRILTNTQRSNLSAILLKCQSANNFFFQLNWLQKCLFIIMNLTFSLLR